MAWTAYSTAVAGNVLTASFWNTDVRDNGNILKTAINDSGHIEFAGSTELTIASGVVTATQNYHRIDTEADASVDEVDTITAGSNVGAGFIVVLQLENAGRTVVFKDGTGNLLLGGDLHLNDPEQVYFLVYDGTNWHTMWRFDILSLAAPATPLINRIYKDSIIKAWVKFDGTGTPAIDKGYNVASITDNGTGDYTLNFATTLTDANYAAVITCVDASGAGRLGVVSTAAAPTASALRIETMDLASVNQDVADIFVIVVGE